MRKPATGFTAIELITVMSILGVLTLFAMPKFGQAVRSSSVRSAKQSVVGYLTRARSAAIQNGRPAVFALANGEISVYSEVNGNKEFIGNAVNVAQEFNVELGATRAEFRFDPRGFAVGLANLEKIYLQRDDKRDSICVTRLGKISPRGCGL